MHNTLFIIRGLPGSGKTTLAKELVGVENVFEADLYFYKDNEYNFNPKLLSKAHEACYTGVENAMLANRNKIAVSNTFVQTWEYFRYILLAQEHHYTVFILTCENNFGSVHNVPAEVIQNMRNKWEPTMVL